MTPRPQDAPAAIAATPAALRATAVATTAAASSPPGDQATSRPTTTDEKWGQIRPSRWGHAKSSFSPFLAQPRFRAGAVKMRVGGIEAGALHGNPLAVPERVGPLGWLARLKVHG